MMMRLFLLVHQAATILLVRLLAWRRISAAVRGDEAIRFVMLMGQRQANKGALFARLVSYPQVRASQRKNGHQLLPGPLL